MSTVTDAAGTAPSVIAHHADAAPLEGLIVLDLTHWMSGPYCGMMLADGGATVIKVEPPTGERTRMLRPMLEDADGTQVSGYFLRLNRGKKSVTIDLKSPEGKEAFLRLVDGADVVLENFRPGVMDSLGLGYEVLSARNPRVIYTGISGFGRTPGPYRDWPAFNQVAEAVAAAVHWDGDVPTPVGPALGDLFPSLHATVGTLMALLRRQLTGRGSLVDIAMYDSLVSFNELTVAWPSMTGQDYRKLGSNVNLNLAPYGFFQAKDGYVCVGVSTDKQWADLAKAMDHPELAADERVAKGPDRVRNAPEVIFPILRKWLSSLTKAEAARIIAEAGVPAAPVHEGSDVLKNEQAIARGMIDDVFAPGGGHWKIPASPLHFEPPFERPTHRAPALGEDNETYL